MTTTQDLGHCKHCGFQWVIGEASVYGKTGSKATASEPGLKCPACGSSNIKVKKESTA